MRKKIVSLIDSIIGDIEVKKREKVAYRILPYITKDINLDLTNPKQKRVLICYIPLHDVDVAQATHANFMHINQMLHYFCRKDYRVDICSCDMRFRYDEIKNRDYDIIIGFGKTFKEIIKRKNIPLKISFITENNPEVVTEKYHERLDYFKQRHPEIKEESSIARNDFFDIEQFQLADYAIHMNSRANAKSLHKYFKRVWTVNANAIANTEFTFKDDEIRQSIAQNKKHLLWFGSTGLIHKGVDIIIDAMRLLPDCTCDFYGLWEVDVFNKLKASNTVNCGRIKVQSSDFIDKIALGHSFQIFPSCSEGMSTAVCTCMSVGIIPILTEESGFDPHPGIILLENFSVECVAKTIKELLALPEEKILEMRRMVYNYAQEAFSLKHFDRQFSNIMDEIIELHEQDNQAS
jgi:glycosyltransferase involved in cell wall biosynthesis